MTHPELLAELKAEISKPKRSSLFDRLKALIVWLSTIAGIGGLSFFLPRVGVSSSSPLTEDPFSTPFSVTNTGNFPVGQVNAACQLNHVRSDANDAALENDFVGESFLKPVGYLSPGESTTVYCVNPIAHFPHPQGLNGDVTLVVSYHPMSIPFWRRTASFHFQLAHQSDGQVRWLPLSNSQ